MVFTTIQVNESQQNGSKILPETKERSVFSTKRGSVEEPIYFHQENMSMQ